MKNFGIMLLFSFSFSCAFRVLPTLRLRMLFCGFEKKSTVFCLIENLASYINSMIFSLFVICGKGCLCGYDLVWNFSQYCVVCFSVGFFIDLSPAVLICLNCDWMTGS